MLRAPAALLIAAATTVTTAAAAAPLPYRVSVVVGYDSVQGPQQLRTALEREIAARLGSARCFEAVGRPKDDPAPRDLLLEVRVGEVEEESRYATSLATRATSDNPEVQRMMVAEVSAPIRLVIRSAAERIAVRDREWTEQTSRQPVVGEDPREAAREQWVAGAARRVTKVACRGSARSWEKELRKARGKVPAR